MMQSCSIIFFQDQIQATRQLATWYIVVMGSSCLFVGVFILKPTVKSFGLRRTLILGLMSQCLHVVLYTTCSFLSSLTASKVLILTACILGGFAGMNFPMVAAMKSNAVSAQMQGRIQGAIGSLQYSALALGPLIGGSMLSFFSKAHPSLGLTQPFYAAPFALSMLLSPLAIAAACSLPETAEHVEGPAEREIPESKVDKLPEQGQILTGA